VPWDQALDQILKINGLGYELEGNIMRIAPLNVLEQEARRALAVQQAQALSLPLRTVVKRLSYSQAREISALLQRGGGGVMSQRGSVIVDNRTNTLILKELPTYIDTVLAIIDTLDTPEPQVMIEARIVETTSSSRARSASRWASARGRPGARQHHWPAVPYTGGRRRHQPADGRRQRLHRPRSATCSTPSSSKRTPAGGGGRGPGERALGAQDRDPQQQLGVDPERRAAAHPDGGEQHHLGAVRQRHAQARRHAARHRGRHGDARHQRAEARTALRLPAGGSAQRADRHKDAGTRVIAGDTTVIGGIQVSRPGQTACRSANVPLLGNLFKNKRAATTTTSY
jgi:hypothetical protein